MFEWKCVVTLNHDRDNLQLIVLLLFSKHNNSTKSYRRKRSCTLDLLTKLKLMVF